MLASRFYSDLRAAISRTQKLAEASKDAERIGLAFLPNTEHPFSFLWTFLQPWASTVAAVMQRRGSED